MDFRIRTLLSLFFLSTACFASYNPYSFFFYFTQKACVPLSEYSVSNYPYSNNTYENKWVYGTDLDYMMEMWSYYPPLYIESSQNNSHDYVWNINMRLYKQKNEDFYRFSYHLSTLSFWKHRYSSCYDAMLPTDVVKQIFEFTQFPVKEFPENTLENNYYSLSTHSLKELSEKPRLNAVKGLIAFINLMLEPQKMVLKFDENDLNTTMNFRKKWLSLDTWSRWAD
jgi:hypothetical protein